MRGRRDTHPLLGDDNYIALQNAIIHYFAGNNILPALAPELAFRPQHFQNGHTSFAVATGDQEAIYGWITANYSLGRLENGGASHGFLEMGGQSVQIAYEVQQGSNQSSIRGQPGHGVLCPRVTANGREFCVFTKMISGLGTTNASAKYI